MTTAGASSRRFRDFTALAEAHHGYTLERLRCRLRERYPLIPSSLVEHAAVRALAMARRYEDAARIPDHKLHAALRVAIRHSALSYEEILAQVAILLGGELVPKPVYRRIKSAFLEIGDMIAAELAQPTEASGLPRTPIPWPPRLA